MYPFATYKLTRPVDSSETNLFSRVASDLQVKSCTFGLNNNITHKSSLWLKYLISESLNN